MRRCNERGDERSNAEGAEEEQPRCAQLADRKDRSRDRPERPNGDSEDQVARLPAAARPFCDTRVGPTIVYERSPTESSAEPTPSAVSHVWTVSITATTERDSHSERTRTSFRPASNES